IHGEQLWLLCNGLDDWTKWSWTSSYTLLQWNENNTVTAMPEGDLMLYVDKCDYINCSYLRWGRRRTHLSYDCISSDEPGLMCFLRPIAWRIYRNTKPRWP